MADQTIRPMLEKRMADHSSALGPDPSSALVSSQPGLKKTTKFDQSVALDREVQ